MKPAATLWLALAFVGLAILAGTAAPALIPFAVSPPAVIMDFDGHAVQGHPVALAWSGTAGTFYLQTVEGYQPKLVTRHYTITVGDKAPVKITAEPDWATQYWAFKSRRDAPAQTDLLIAVDQRVDRNRIPNQSLADKARGMESGGGAIALQGAENAANDSQNRSEVKSLRLKNTIIGEFYDAPLIPGLTFGWSPATQHAVAYADTHGRLAIFDYFLDAAQTVDGTDHVLLPAWSMDGMKIVFLEQTGKKRFSLEQVTVTRR